MSRQPRMIEQGQIPAIWRSAKRAKLSDEHLYDRVAALCGERKMHSLSYVQAEALRRDLDRLSGDLRVIEVTNPDGTRVTKGMITKPQQGALWAKMRELGWNKETLNAFIEKKAGVSHERFLTVNQARAILTAMQAMIDRNQNVTRAKRAR